MTILDTSLTVPLVDHHCHGIMREDLSRSDFELLATESDWPEPKGMTIFDSPFGVTIRAECAPVLGLPRHCSADDYWAARSALGQEGVSRAFMPSLGIETLVIDSGFRGTSILGVAEMGEIAQARAVEIVRLEAVAESLVGRTSSDSFAADFERELALRGSTAVGFKSIIAYRYGLDFDPRPPTPDDVRVAAREWLATVDPDRPRMDHPVLLRHILWAAVPHQKPIQFHVGYGDSDIVLHRCDPSQMTEFMRATVDSGIQIMLLHCYPYIREAGILAQVFPHVWLDTGVAINYTGPSSPTTIRQSLEMAPFGKVLFSSDAFGLPEIYYCGVLLWRRGIAEIFTEWVGADRLGIDDAARYMRWIGRDNALRAYGLVDA